MKAIDITSWILLLAAVASGVGAYFLLQDYLGSEEQRLREAAEQSQGPMTRVVVATRDLAPGTRVSRQTMAIGELPQRHVSARAVLPADFDGLENRVLNRPMSAGEPLLDDFISGMAVERFSDLLAPGTRALSLEVSALESHSGLLLPGDYIDLFVLLPAGEGRRERKLEGLIERVKVLAAGQQPLHSADQPYQPLDSEGGSYSLITVGLPWADAERTLRARRAGEVVYLLRPAGDERLRFEENGLARFGARPARAAQATGYAYFSGNVPRGERRGEKAPPNSVDSLLAAEDEDEDATDDGQPREVGWQDEPLPLDILFKQVPKADGLAGGTGHRTRRDRPP